MGQFKSVPAKHSMRLVIEDRTDDALYGNRGASKFARS